MNIFEDCKNITELEERFKLITSSEYLNATENMDDVPKHGYKVLIHFRERREELSTQ